jgi:hypothetical protein
MLSILIEFSHGQSEAAFLNIPSHHYVRPLPYLITCRTVRCTVYIYISIDSVQTKTTHFIVYPFTRDSFSPCDNFCDHL